MSESKTLDLIKKILLWTFPIIFIMGSFGNIISFIIFRSDKFKNTIFYTYFSILNILNTITITYSINDFLSYQYGISIQNTSVYFCKLNLYIIYSMAPVASYIIVIVGLDRMISIICPCKFTFRNSIIFQYAICLPLLIFNMAFYTPLIIYSDYELVINNATNSTSYECKLNDNGLTYKMDLFNSTIVPFILMISSTSVTIYGLFNSRKKANNKIKKKDIRFALTSIFLDICFFILNLPIALYLYLSDYIYIDSKLGDFLYVVTSVFYYMNFGVMFYINFYVNNVFKKELQSLYIRRFHLNK